MWCQIVYHVMDADGEISHFSVDVESTDTYDAELFAAELGGMLLVLIRGGPMWAKISFPVAIPGGDRTAFADADIQEVFSFVRRTIQKVKRKLGIPTANEAFLIAGTKDLYTPNPDIASVITALVEGMDVSGLGGTGMVVPQDERGQTFTEMIAAFEDWGRRRKRSRKVYS